MRSYLVTGDKDLLDLKKYQNTEIIPIDMFESGTAPLKNGTTKKHILKPGRVKQICIIFEIK